MHCESCVVVDTSAKPLQVAQTGLQLAEEGMQRTLEAEREEWIIQALEALQRYSRLPGRHEFTTEAFRAWFNRPPHSHKVWGALTNRACKVDVIEWTGRYIPSVSPKTHGHPVKLWRASFSLSSPATGMPRARLQINERTKTSGSEQSDFLVGSG